MRRLLSTLVGDAAADVRDDGLPTHVSPTGTPVHMGVPVHTDIPARGPRPVFHSDDDDYGDRTSIAVGADPYGDESSSSGDDGSPDYHHGDTYSGRMPGGEMANMRLPGRAFSQSRRDYVENTLLHYTGDGTFVLTVYDDQIMLATRQSGLIGFLALLMHALMAERAAAASADDVAAAQGAAAQLSDYLDSLYDSIPWYLRTVINTTYPGVLTHARDLAVVMRHQRDLAADALSSGSDDDHLGIDPRGREARHLKQIIAMGARRFASEPESPATATATAAAATSTVYSRAHETLRNRRAASSGAAAAAEAGMQRVEAVAAAVAEAGEEAPLLLLVPHPLFYMYRMFSTLGGVRTALLALPRPELARALRVDDDATVQAVVGTAAQLDGVRTQLVDRLSDFVGDWRAAGPPSDGAATMMRVSAFAADASALLGQLARLQSALFAHALGAADSGAAAHNMVATGGAGEHDAAPHVAPHHAAGHRRAPPQPLNDRGLPPRAAPTATAGAAVTVAGDGARPDALGGAQQQPRTATTAGTDGYESI